MLWRLGRELPVIFDVRSAQVTDQGGLMAVELTGTAEMLDRAVGWLRRHHVGVSPAI
ncbi:MAG: NIL domain-containing protein [Limisphaerales bacterium]